MVSNVEHAYFPQPFLEATSGVVVSPFQFGLDGNDVLRIKAANALVGGRIVVNGRRLTSEGTIEPFSFVHVPNADRTVTTTVHPLGVGSLLNLAAFVEGSTPSVGQCFVIVQIVRGLTGPQVLLGTLLQGYVTSTQGLGWPGSPIQNSLDTGGYIKSWVGAGFGAGAEWRETVPTGARWQLLWLLTHLSTAAGGTDRLTAMRMQQGGLDLHMAIAAVAVPPSSGRNFHYTPNLPVQEFPLFGVSHIPLPDPTILVAGDTFGSYTANMGAGDLWDAPLYRVREWLDLP